jgi:hypothetical protein
MTSGTRPRATYENFIVDCPSCHRSIIFNRVTDLGTVQPIAHKQVNCLYADCRASFSISGDLANARYEMLLYDCYDLLSEKHYAYCVLNVVQAVEAFVSHFLRVELAIKPFWLEGHHDIRQVNCVITSLFEAIKAYGFRKLRNIFLNWHLRPPIIRSLDDAEAFLQQLPTMVGDPSDTQLATLPNQRLATLLLALKASTANELRNAVVHRHRYRPSRAEAENVLKEVRGFLLPLAALLGVTDDDVNAYNPGA